MAGAGVQRAQELQRGHVRRARSVLTALPPGDARTALHNILRAMTHSHP
jgi:hypothetical protein